MWIPFGMENEMNDALVEDVPDYMLNSMVDWVCDAELMLCFDEEYYSYNRELIIDKDDRHELVKEFDRKTRIASMLYDADTRYYFLKVEDHKTILLTYVDFLILKLSEIDSQGQAGDPFIGGPYNSQVVGKQAGSFLAELNSILEESGSVWKVGIRRGYAGLERRVTGLMQKTAETLMSNADASVRFLSSAWNYAFGRTPNYSEAYADAIKAVEAIAAPIIEPKNAQTTLSKLAKVMREQTGWCFEIETRKDNNVPGGVIQLLMSAMMNSQSDRHGSGNVEATTKEQAEAAVFTAVLLVQAFRSGLVTRRIG